MANEENKTKIQPGEDTPATAPDETRATEPSKIKLPDGREVTPDEVVKGLELLENKPKWERELHEKGERYNEQLRDLEARGHETESLKRELKEIKEQIANAPKADDDWEHEDDPDKKTQKFYRSVSNSLNRFGDRIGKIEQGRTADLEARKERETLQYWDNVYTNACADNSIPNNMKANDFVRTYVKGKMVDVGGRNWDTRKINEWAKEAKDYILSTGQEAVNTWSKKKVKEKEQVPPSVGTKETPAPKAGPKIKGGMSLQEQMKVMADDPNLQ